MIKVLVTGANGQLGSEIKSLSPDFGDLQFAFYDLPELDICSKENLNHFISEEKPSFIINCAAYTNVDKAEEEKEKAFMVNAEAVKILGGICEKNDIKLFHISTDYVFRGDGHKPYREESETGPVSVYGISKLKGEEYLKNNKNAIIIRTSWLYSSSGQSFVSKILARSQNGKLRVIYDQTGSPTYAKDLASVILKIIIKSVNNSQGFINGIYHYTNEGLTSWYDFAVEILKFHGKECQISPVESHEFPTPAKRPHYSVLSKQKIKETYNITIPHWRESLQKCMEEIKSASAKQDL